MKFSIKNLHELSETKKVMFFMSLVKKLQLFEDEIANDDVLNKFIRFVFNPQEIEIADNYVENLYSAASAGVQAGSGNQSLYLDILNAICESWKQIQ